METKLELEHYMDAKTQWKKLTRLRKTVNQLRYRMAKGERVTFPKWSNVLEGYFQDTNWTFAGQHWEYRQNKDVFFNRYASRYLNRRLVITVVDGFVEEMSEY